MMKREKRKEMENGGEGLIGDGMEQDGKEGERTVNLISYGLVQENTGL